MSFKKKKEVKIKLDDGESDSKRKSMTEGGNALNSSNGSELSGEIINGSGSAGDAGVGWMGKSVHTDIETETAGEGMGEGTLVWAKMRVSSTAQYSSQFISSTLSLLAGLFVLALRRVPGSRRRRVC